MIVYDVGKIEPYEFSHVPTYLLRSAQRSELDVSLYQLVQVRGSCIRFRRTKDMELFTERFKGHQYFSVLFPIRLKTFFFSLY